MCAQMNEEMIFSVYPLKRDWDDAFDGYRAFKARLRDFAENIGYDDVVKSHHILDCDMNNLIGDDGGLVIACKAAFAKKLAASALCDEVIEGTSYVTMEEGRLYSPKPVFIQDHFKRFLT